MAKGVLLVMTEPFEGDGEDNEVPPVMDTSAGIVYAFRAIRERVEA